MPITDIPARTEGDLGQPKVDGPNPYDPASDLNSSIWNRLVTRLITAYEAIGLDDGTTVGSLRAAVASIFVSLATKVETDDARLSDARAPTAHVHADAISGGASGFMTGADKARLNGMETNADVTDADNVAAAGAVMNTFVLTSGNGMTGGGALTGAGRSIHVAPHADGSIAVTADAVGVGVLATDAQHGTRGGGTLHANAVAGGAAGFMTGADKTKLDGVAAGATVGPSLSSTTPAPVGTAAVGTGVTVARADHVHAHGNQAGGALHANVVAAGAAGFMTGADKTKLDGITAGATATPLSNAIPVAVGTAATDTAGVSTLASRADHRHDHGDQAGGSLHADVISNGASGFMAGTDKAKLDAAVALAKATPAASGATAIFHQNTPRNSISLPFIDSPTGEPAVYSTPYYLELNDAGNAEPEHVVVIGRAGDQRTLAGRTKFDYWDGSSTAAYAGPATSPNQATGLVTAVQVQQLAAAAPLSNAIPLPMSTSSGAQAGISDSAARADHRHVVSADLAEVTGVISDAQHGNQAGGALHADVVAAGASGFMTGADKTKLNGIAAGATANTISNFTPFPTQATGNAGVSTALARYDHRHAHGDHLGGSLHADAIASGASGFMTGADKAKLNGIESFATANDVETAFFDPNLSGSPSPTIPWEWSMIRINDQVQIDGVFNVGTGGSGDVNIELPMGGNDTSRWTLSVVGAGNIQYTSGAWGSSVDFKVTAAWDTGNYTIRITYQKA